MKIKTFISTDTEEDKTYEDVGIKFDEQYNTWRKKNPAINVVKEELRTNAEHAAYHVKLFLILTIWYEEPEKEQKEDC